jgi:hypothetical protein
VNRRASGKPTNKADFYFADGSNQDCIYMLLAAFTQPASKLSSAEIFIPKN